MLGIYKTTTIYVYNLLSGCRQGCGPPSFSNCWLFSTLFDPPQKPVPLRAMALLMTESATLRVLYAECPASL